LAQILLRAQRGKANDMFDFKLIDFSSFDRDVNQKVRLEKREQ